MSTATVEQTRLFDDGVIEKPTPLWCDNFAGDCRYQIKGLSDLVGTECPQCGEGKLEQSPF